MPPLQSEYLDWKLSDPKDPPTLVEWARQNGVHVDSPKRWRKDGRFREEWEKRAAAKNISTDRVQSVVDVLYKAATDNGDVKAAQMYLQYVQPMLPKRGPAEIGETVDTKQLSDEDLVEELRQLAGELDDIDAN